MKDFRQLKVWENAHELTLVLYRLTTGFPKHELFGLVGELLFPSGDDSPLRVVYTSEHRRGMWKNGQL